MLRHTSFIALAMCSLMAMPAVASPMSADETIAKLEQMASPAGEKNRNLAEEVVDGIERNSPEVSKRLLPKLADKTLPEKQLAVYVWALGFAKNPSTVDAIVEVYRRNKSELIGANCLRALAMIGGKPAEDFLLARLDETKNKEMRFNILNLLAQMQCEAALAKTETILTRDPKESYWQALFVFGKMGDKAVPFLLKKIDDKNRNVREHVIHVLGDWLMAPEAVEPFKKRLLSEKDPELRLALLYSLTEIIPDLSELQKTLRDVLANESDEKVAKVLRKAVDAMGDAKGQLAAVAKKKRVSAVAFQQEYDKLFKSAGKKGDYEVLFLSSTAKDEPKLKALRERILQRDSDEAFYDYRKVNQIILQNRMLKAVEPASPPAAP